MLITNNLPRIIKRLDDAFDDDWKEWLPETLKSAITARWGGISDLGLSRILAARNLLKFGWFWHDVDVFEATANAFNWNDFDNRENIKPSPGQIVFAVKVAGDIVKPRKFDEDVAQYIAAIFLDRGYVYIPDNFNLPNVQYFIDVVHKDTDFRDAVKVKWESMMDGQWYEFEEVPVDVQVAKLLAIRKFVKAGGTGAPSDKNRALAQLILN